VCGQQVQQLLQAGGIVADAASGQQRPLVDQSDVVMIASPVDTAEHFHGPILSFVVVGAFALVKAAWGTRLPDGRALVARHPISRSQPQLTVRALGLAKSSLAPG
jgi:hypothetical protein